MKTTTYIIIKKFLQMPSINLFINTYLYNYMYNTHSLKTNICHFIYYKPSTKTKFASYIIIYVHITIWQSGWKFPDSVSEHRNICPAPLVTKRQAAT